MNLALSLSLIVVLTSFAESDYGSGDWEYYHHHGGWHGETGWGHGDGSTAAVPEETRTLDALHAAALAEGGRVIVYAGGDTAGEQDGTKAAFEKRFPGMTADIVVDYSKYHDARIDNQLATNTLVPDVAQLQTLQDFPRWKEQRVLLQYKPKGFRQVFDQFKDSDGYYMAIFVIVFSMLVSRQQLPDNSTWPKTSLDLLKPQFKDHKIILAYPNDDDAVLFWFYQVVEKYGWGYLDAFVKQNPVYVRGTQEPRVQVNNGSYPVAVGVDGVLPPGATDPSVLLLPEGDDPFVTWPQTAAIFKGAKHPAAAKLYLNWILSPEFQQNWPLFSVRKDVPKEGYPGVLNIRNSDPTAFGKWMADRGAVERFRQQMTLYVGEVKGEPSPGHLDLHQAKALPH